MSQRHLLVLAFVVVFAAVGFALWHAFQLAEPAVVEAPAPTVP